MIAALLGMSANYFDLLKYISAGMAQLHCGESRDCPMVVTGYYPGGEVKERIYPDGSSSGVYVYGGRFHRLGAAFT